MFDCQGLIPMNLRRRPGLYAEHRLTEADAMRRLSFGMNLSLDGYIAAPGDDLGWSEPSDELFQWWSDRVAATGLALYGRKLWETMSSHWPTADQQPGATPAQIDFARRWRDMPKVVGAKAPPGPNRRPAAGPPPATDCFRPPLAGHAEGCVLVDDQRGRLERPPGHRRPRHRDHQAEDRGRRSPGHRRRHPRRGGHAGRADRRVHDRHPSSPGRRRDAVLHGAGQLGEADPGGDPDVS